MLIADDEPLARERLRTLLRAYAPDAELREVGDGTSAVETIRAWRPDAVLLDIQMPGGDGFSVIEQVGADAMPPTVFVTAYDAHALRAFEVAALDYLLKPFDDARFATAWERLVRARAADSVLADPRGFEALLAALTQQRAAAPPPAAAFLERVLVRVGDRSFPVALRDVHWMQSDGNYVDLYTAAGRHTIRETLQELETKLDPARFVRVHRRVIVALDQIKELQPWFAGDQVLILRNGTKLRVSRTRREALAARLEGRR